VTEFYRALGKADDPSPPSKKKVPGHVAKRPQAALYSEVVHSFSEGVVSVGDARYSRSWGPGRWGPWPKASQNHLGRRTRWHRDSRRQFTVR